MKALFTFISSSWVLGLALFCVPSMVLADSAETADSLATRLSELRAEVESLSQELGQRQGDYRANCKATLAKKPISRSKLGVAQQPSPN